MCGTVNDWTENDVEGSCNGLLLRYYTNVCLKEPRKSVRRLSWDSWCADTIWKWDRCITAVENCLVIVNVLVQRSLIEFNSRSCKINTNLSFCIHLKQHEPSMDDALFPLYIWYWFKFKEIWQIFSCSEYVTNQMSTHIAALRFLRLCTRKHLQQSVSVPHHL